VAFEEKNNRIKRGPSRTTTKLTDGILHWVLTPRYRDLYSKVVASCWLVNTGQFRKNYLDRAMFGFPTIGISIPWNRLPAAV
jgi:hypothetical protein